ncbi:MAG: CHAT domain-containing protein, partial [Leptolyngbyaceae cyanobacterium MO_188.B28]|nr:CHAT domain-containing protein [Leptolyngbyaceae cyanobacterium MO_188.B28]
QQAAQVYAAQSNPIRQAINLGNLSLTYQRLGKWAEANQAITESLALLPLDSEITRTRDGQSAFAQVLDIQGHLSLAVGRTEQALATWEKTAELYDQLGYPDRRANSLINQAQALRKLGLYQRAVIILQKVAQPQAQAGQLLEGLEEEPQSELDLQLQPDSCCEQIQPMPLEEESQSELDLQLQAARVNALRSLGDTLQIVGSLEQAEVMLRRSLKQAKALSLVDAIANANLSLGNVIQTKALADLKAKNLTPESAISLLEQAPKLDLIDKALAQTRLEAAQEFKLQTEQALNYYRQAATDESPVTLQAKLNQLKLLVILQKWAKADTLSSQITPLFNHQSPSPVTLKAQMNFAESLMEMAKSQHKPLTPAKQQEVDALLNSAHQRAIALGDYQAKSYALGLMGALYEQNKQFPEAEEVTKQALETVKFSTAEIAQAINDAEIIYRWHWQLGRIHKAQGKRADAIVDYEAAVETLTQLRRDIVTSNLPYRFSFRSNVEEPIYLELIDLLLQADDPDQKNLNRSREIISLLNQAELTNFLQEPCEAITPQQTDKVVDKKAPKTAILYPIILPDRLEVILKLPGDPNLHQYRSRVSQNELIRTLEAFQKDLEEDYTFNIVQAEAKKLYSWIVAPALTWLDSEDIDTVNPKEINTVDPKKIDTLVFALTGALQKIPMAALYDGEQYLIQKYAVAEILGLQLDNPTPLERKSLNILAAGLAEVSSLPDDIQMNFASLPNVNNELKAIEASGISAKTISDQGFTQQNFNTLINAEQFSAVHLATHGQFSSNPQETFLLTEPGGDNDGKIAAADLALLFRVRGRIRPEPIELLVLSACETAAGDELATLGIAGTAFRAGARSVIASLWSLDDAPTVDFAEHFYENLGQSDVSIAEALRCAQLALLNNPQFEHPRYWSTYILAGNWL